MGMTMDDLGNLFEREISNLIEVANSRPNDRVRVMVELALDRRRGRSWSLLGPPEARAPMQDAMATAVAGKVAASHARQTSARKPSPGALASVRRSSPRLP